MAMKLNEFVNYFYYTRGWIHFDCGTQQSMKIYFVFAVDKKHPQFVFWIWFDSYEFTGSHIHLYSSQFIGIFLRENQKKKCTKVSIYRSERNWVYLCNEIATNFDGSSSLWSPLRAKLCRVSKKPPNTQKAERIQNAQVRSCRWVNSVYFSHILKNHYRVILFAKLFVLVIRYWCCCFFRCISTIIDQSQNEYGIHVRIHTHIH